MACRAAVTEKACWLIICGDGVRIARDNPDSGVVVRIAGEGQSVESRCHHRWSRVGDIPDNSVRPGADSGEPVTAEASALAAGRERPSAVKRNAVQMKIVRKMAGNKPGTCRMAKQEQAENQGDCRAGT
ncbi:hypothetical protein OIU92_32390 [Escherichia coli]|nr:hypothetical protein [Escherichia coli]